MRLVLFLHLGGIVNVAVAWACACFVLPTRTMNGTTAQFASGNDTVQGWIVQRWDQFGTTRVLGMHPHDRPSNDPAAAEVLPHWSRFESIATQVGASAIGQTHPASGTFPERPVVPVGVVDDGRGWPLRSMRCWWNWGLSDQTVTESESLHAGIMLAPYVLQRPGMLRLDQLRALPLRPLWPGFAINTIFYAAVLWLLFAAPGFIRRRLRRFRGRCVHCGYDLRGHIPGAGADSIKCPECGQSSPLPRGEGSGVRA